MDLGFITDYYMPIIVLACLCIGYMIKEIDKIPDKYIPTIMGVLGVIFGFIKTYKNTRDFSHEMNCMK